MCASAIAQIALLSVREWNGHNFISEGWRQQIESPRFQAAEQQLKGRIAIRYIHL